MALLQNGWTPAEDDFCLLFLLYRDSTLCKSEVADEVGDSARAFR